MTWENKTLKEVCSVITDGTHQTPKYFETGYKFLSSKNVTSGKIDWENIKYIDEPVFYSLYILVLILVLTISCFQSEFCLLIS